MKYSRNQINKAGQQLIGADPFLIFVIASPIVSQIDNRVFSKRVRERSVASQLTIDNG